MGLDAAILMNPEVWVASGHVSTFNDPLIDCKSCKMRHRADKLVESYVPVSYTHLPWVKHRWPRPCRPCSGTRRAKMCRRDRQ